MISVAAGEERERAWVQPDLFNSLAAKTANAVDHSGFSGAGLCCATLVNRSFQRALTSIRRFRALRRMSATGRKLPTARIDRERPDEWLLPLARYPPEDRHRYCDKKSATEDGDGPGTCSTMVVIDVADCPFYQIDEGHKRDIHSGMIRPR